MRSMKSICRTLTACAFAGALQGIAAHPAHAAVPPAESTAAQQDELPTPQQAARQISTALTALTQTLARIQDKATADTEAARVSALFAIVGDHVLLSEIKGGDYATEINRETRKSESALKQQVQRLTDKKAYNSRLLGMAMPGINYTTLPELTDEEREAQRRLQESERARLRELLKAVHDEASGDAAAIAISTLIRRDLMVGHTHTKVKTRRFIEKQLPHLLKGSEAEVERLCRADCFGSFLLKSILMPHVPQPTIKQG